MIFNTKRATILLCSVAVVTFASAATARPVHKTAHRHYHHQQQQYAAAQAADPTLFNPDRDQRYPAFARRDARVKAAGGQGGTIGRHRNRAYQAMAAAPEPAYGGFASNSLVAEARKYLGTNPTGRRSLWCGAFMDMVLKETGHAGGGNLAKAYAQYGRRVSGPQVGAIAVMGRRGGGHVGVVSGVDPNGNPIIVSGNHNRTVAESVYPRGRIIAYVMPGS